MVVRMDPTTPPPAFGAGSSDADLRAMFLAANMNPDLVSSVPNASSNPMPLSGGASPGSVVPGGPGAGQFMTTTPNAPGGMWQNPEGQQWDTQIGDFYTWSDKELAEFRKRAIEAGLVPQNPSLTQLHQAWMDLVQHSRSYQQAGQNLSPWDLLTSQVDTATPTGQEPFTGTRTRVDKRTQAVDKNAAEGAVRDTVKQMIGRNPTSSQLTRLTGVFRNYFQQHPEKVKTTSRFVEGQEVATNTETLTPGATAEGALQEIKNRVEGTDAYGVYQATGFYGNLLFDMLGQL